MGHRGHCSELTVRGADIAIVSKRGDNIYIPSLMWNNAVMFINTPVNCLARSRTFANVLLFFVVKAG